MTDAAEPRSPDRRRGMVVVFCDVDDTIVRGKSLFSFADELAAHCSAIRALEVRTAFEGVVRLLAAGAPRSEANRTYYQTMLRDRARDDVARVVHSWFSRTSADPHFFNMDVCAFLDRARLGGAQIVLVSGSFPQLLEPIAACVRATHVIAAPLECVSGRYTGRLLGPPVIGDGKAHAVRLYAQRHALALDRCIGIGDDTSDLPFLSLVGSQYVPASANDAMLRHARAAGWQLI